MTPRWLLLSPHAAIDLEEIAEHIARDNPVRGRKLRRRVGSEMPGGRRDAELYPARTDLAPGLRMAVHGRMSCCIATCRARMPCASNAWCTVPATCRGWSDRRNRRGLVLGTRPSIKRDLDCGIASRGSCIHRYRYLLSLKAYQRLLRAAGEHNDGNPTPGQVLLVSDPSVCRHQEIEARLLRGGQQGAIAQPIPSSRLGP